MRHLKSSLLRLLLLVFCIGSCFHSYAEQLIADRHLQIKGKESETMTFQLLKGDQISLKVISPEGERPDFGVEVIEYPQTVRYSASKSERSREADTSTYAYTASISAPHTIRISNLAHSSRLLNVLLVRESADGNQIELNDYWINKDSIIGYKENNRREVIRYDTAYENVKHRELASVDTVYEPVLNKTFKINSATSSVMHLSSRTEDVEIKLPDDKRSKDEVDSLVSYSYWIGVGKDAKDLYEKENKIAMKLVGAVVSFVLKDYAALIVGSMQLLDDPNGGDNVIYALRDSVGTKERVLDSGNVTAVSGSHPADNPNRKLYLSLKNDNYVTSLDVEVRILAKKLHRVWNDKVVKEQRLNPVYQEIMEREPQIVRSRQKVVPFFTESAQ